MKIGDFCRIGHSTPARYIGHGLAVGPFVMEAVMRVGPATPLEPDADRELIARLPMASWPEVETAAAVVEWIARHPEQEAAVQWRSLALALLDAYDSLSPREVMDLSDDHRRRIQAALAELRRLGETDRRTVYDEPR